MILLMFIISLGILFFNNVRDENVDYKASDCSKLPQNVFVTMYICVRKTTNEKMSKVLKFDHIDEWNMQKSEFHLESDTHKYLQNV